VVSGIGVHGMTSDDNMSQSAGRWQSVIIDGSNSVEGSALCSFVEFRKVWTRFHSHTVADCSLDFHSVYFGFRVLCRGLGSVRALLLGAKSMEVIQLELPGPRKLIGQRCVVARGVGRTKRGLVRVHGRNGRLDSELWSAESEHEIAEGREAQVVGMHRSSNQALRLSKALISQPHGKPCKHIVFVLLVHSLCTPSGAVVWRGY
jgi:hypothetical protein